MKNNGARGAKCVVEMTPAGCTSSAAAAGGDVQSIYRVPEWLKKTNNMTAYRPQVMALGPFHHHDPNLKAMEEHKTRAVVRRLTQSRKTLEDYLAAVRKVEGKLKTAYGKDLGKEGYLAADRKVKGKQKAAIGKDLEWLGQEDRSFADVMVSDGCFLLELVNLSFGNDVPGDLFFSAHNYMYMRGVFISDVLAMENQLPLLLLKTILCVHHGTTTPNAPNNGDVNVEDQTDGKIHSRMLRFLGRPAHVRPVTTLGLHPSTFTMQVSPTYGGGPGDRTEQGKMEEIMPSAVEIHEAGIRFKKSKTDSLLDVHFERGVLSMPALMVDDGFESAFLNLMAFEHRHAGAGNDVTAYVFFMDNIIDTAQDVSLLKAKGIFKNYLGSDEALAGLINDTLSKGAVMSRTSVINMVQHQVQHHCKKPWNKWRANFMHTYFRNPWVFISLVAASILLLATVLQTIYTIVAFNQPSASRSPHIND